MNTDLLTSLVCTLNSSFWGGRRQNLILLIILMFYSEFLRVLHSTFHRGSPVNILTKSEQLFLITPLEALHFHACDICHSHGTRDDISMLS